MKKQFSMMIIIITFAILGLVAAVVVYNLYTNGIVIDELVDQSETISITDLTFLICLVWTFMGVVIGVLKS